MTTYGKLFGEIIEQRLKALNTNAFSAERAAGLPVDAIRNVIRSEKKSGPTLSRVEEICDALGLELYIGPVRDVAGTEQPPAADPAELADIPLYNADLAAGLGVDNGAEHVADYLAFRRDWLRKIGVAPANAVLARVTGDSMQPSIWAGDLVLIDRSRTDIPVRRMDAKSRYRSPVYALLDDGQARVKRIERPAEDQVLLLSDNPDFGPELTNVETLSIIGKVVWWGHTSKE